MGKQKDAGCWFLLMVCRGSWLWEQCRFWPKLFMSFPHKPPNQSDKWANSHGTLGAIHQLIQGHYINGNFRILKQRYCTIFLAIFSGDIPSKIGIFSRPYIWKVPPINRFLKWPLKNIHIIVYYPIISHYCYIRQYIGLYPNNPLIISMIIPSYIHQSAPIPAPSSR